MVGPLSSHPDRGLLPAVLFPGYAYTPHNLSLGPHRMHYLDEGDGKGKTLPVLMLHGNPGWSYSYRHLVAALRGSYRCIVPDHIGMGRSSRPRATDYRFTLSQRLRDLSLLLDTLVPRGSVHLVLHDWGVMIGMAWAARHPERIGSLVVLNGAAFPLPTGQSLHWTLRLARAPLLGPLLVRGLNLFCLGTLRYGVRSAKLSAAERAAYLLPYCNWNARLAVHAFVSDIPIASRDQSWDTMQETAEGLTALLDKPMLIVWGMQDFVFDAAFLAEWLRRFPSAQVQRLPVAGHCLLEDGRETLTALIPDFLAP